MKNKEDYPVNWNDTIRPLMLKVRGYKCEQCKVKHRSIGYYDYKKNFVECDVHMQDWAIKNNFKLIKIHLQVHHINGNRKQNAEWNLKVLCPRCHFAADREMNKLKKKLKGLILPNNK